MDLSFVSMNFVTYSHHTQILLTSPSNAMVTYSPTRSTWIDKALSCLDLVEVLTLGTAFAREYCDATTAREVNSQYAKLRSRATSSD